jgi:hypothetical protein
LRLSDRAGLRERLGEQGRVVLALDGLQPDVGHEVLWVLRDCLSGEVLLTRSLFLGASGSFVMGMGIQENQSLHWRPIQKTMIVSAKWRYSSQTTH